MDTFALYGKVLNINVLRVFMVAMLNNLPFPWTRATIALANQADRYKFKLNPGNGHHSGFTALDKRNLQFLLLFKLAQSSMKPRTQNFLPSIFVEDCS